MEATERLDTQNASAHEPEEVAALPEDITSVGAGHYHSMAVSRTGELWAWGRNSEGQLGERDETLNSREKWHVPLRVRGLESVEVTSARGSGRFLNHCGIKFEKMKLQVH